jgi:hypothetical protein
MKSITIHKLDNTLESLIRKTAHKEGLSLNRTITKMLEKAFGIQSGKKGNNIDGYKDLSGVWNDKDFELFERNTSDFEKTDQGDWQ